MGSKGQDKEDTNKGNKKDTTIKAIIKNTIIISKTPLQDYIKMMTSKWKQVLCLWWFKIASKMGEKKKIYNNNIVIKKMTQCDFSVDTEISEQYMIFRLDFLSQVNIFKKLIVKLHYRILIFEDNAV